MAPGLEDVLDIARLVRIARQFLGGEQLGEPDDRVQRRAQLVAEPRQELVLSALPHPGRVTVDEDAPVRSPPRRSTAS